MSNELETFIHTMTDDRPKLASEDFDALSIGQLELLLGVGTFDPEFEKEASLTVGPGGQQWLDQFVGTPLYDSAMALREKELEIESERIHRRMEDNNKDLWTAGDMVRLDKDKLELKLHKLKSAVAKEASAEPAELSGPGNVEYGGNVGTGSSAAPAWPRAAMGVDGAGRKATPNESTTQNSIYPQTDTPKTSSLLDAIRRR